MGHEHVEYDGLTKFPFDQFLEDLKSLNGVRTYDINKDKKLCRVGMKLPDGQTELTAIINVLEDNSFLDAPDTPEITPPCFLRFHDIIYAYGLQLQYSK